MAMIRDDMPIEMQDTIPKITVISRVNRKVLALEVELS